MKSAILFVTTLLFMAISGKVYAEDGKSSVNVNIQQDINDSSNNSQTSTSDTYVRTEVNGEVKEFRSNNGENISYQSDNGNVKVNIKNSGKTSTDSATPKTLNDEAKEKVQKKVLGAKDSTQKKAIEKKIEAQKKLEKVRDRQKANILHRIELFFGDFKKRFFKD